MVNGKMAHKLLTEPNGSALVLRYSVFPVYMYIYYIHSALSKNKDMCLSIDSLFDSWPFNLLLPTNHLEKVIPQLTLININKYYIYIYINTSQIC